MTKDPVCGMQVDEKNSQKSSHQGQTYYFCSSECKRKFEQNPQQYTREKTRTSGGS